MSSSQNVNFVNTCKKLPKSKNCQNKNSKFSISKNLEIVSHILPMIVVIKRDRYERSEDIKQSDEREIKELYVYKHQGILEADMVKDQEMKYQIQ